MKKAVVFVLLSITLTILGCSKSKSEAEDSLNALSATECFNLLKKIDERERNNNCSEITSDINKIEKKCGEFLDEEQKKSLVLAKKLCEEN